MITWTTYGTWLQGDERGYVKDGDVLEKNEKLENANRRNQTGKTVKMTKKAKEIVEEALLNESEKLGQVIYSLAVCSNHVHLVVDRVEEMIEEVAARYKKAASGALHANGFAGQIWTRGYDKRFCFDEKSLQDRIAYVHRHE